MATHNLVVKFTDIGLAEMKKNVKEATDTMGRDFEGVVKKAQTKIAELQAKRAGALGAVGAEEIKKLDEQLTTEFQKIARTVQSAFKTLRTQTDSQLGAIATSAKSALAAIQQAGTATERELARAQQGMAVRMRQSDASLTAIPQQISAAFKNLGVESEAVIKEMRRAIVLDFKLVKESGVATAEEIKASVAGMKQALRDIDNRKAIDAFKLMGVVSQQAADDAKRQWLQAFREIEAKGNAIDTALAQRALTKKLEDIDKSRSLDGDVPKLTDTFDPFKTLGFRSSETLKKLREDAILAFQVIKAEGEKSGRDVTAAYQRLQQVLHGIDLELNVKSNAEDIEDSFRALNIRSQAQINELKQKLYQHFEAIRTSGKKSAEEVARAFKAFQEGTKALDLELKGVDKTKDQLSEVERAFRNLGAHSEEEIEELKKKARADFETIKNDGTKSAKEIERAFQAMEIRIKDADNLRLPVNQPRTPQAPRQQQEQTPFQRLNISSLAEFRAKQSEIVDAYNKIAATAQRGSADAIRAHNAMKASLAELNEEFKRQNGAIEGSGVNWRKLLFTISGVTLAISGLIFVTKSLALTLASPFKAIGDLEGRFEKFEATLRSLGDASDRAGQSTKWVKDVVFSNKTIFSTDAVTDAFIKLRASGIDPTRGSLQSLLDAIAATGGSEEKLNRAAFAIQQIASKGRAYSEEVIQQLAEALPGTVKIVAEAFGFVAEDTGKLLEQMKKKGIGAKDFLTALFNQLQTNFSKTGKEFMNTYPGILLQFKNLYQRFLDETANAGAFDGLKKALTDILAQLNRAFTDGRAQAWAKQLSDTMVGMLDTGRKLVKFFDDWGKAILSLAGTLALFASIKAAISGIITLGAGIAALRTAFVAWHAGIVLAEGAMVLLSRTALAALGPLGWLVGLGIFFGVAANKAGEYANKVRDAKKAQDDFDRGRPVTLDKRAKAASAKVEAEEKIQQAEAENQELAQKIEDSTGTTQRAQNARLRQRIAENLRLIAQLKGDIEALDKLIKSRTPLEKAGDLTPGEQASRADSQSIIGGLDDLANSKKGEDEDAVASRVRALKIQQIQDQIERVRTAAKVEIDLEEAKYKKQLIGINQYYDNRIAIEKKALAREAALYGEAAAFLKTTPTKDEADRLEVEAKISNLLNEQAKARIKLGAVEEVNNADREKALDAFEAKMKQLDIDNERFSGNRAAAEELRLKRQYDALRKEIQANFEDDPVRIIIELDRVRVNEELAKARARFTDFEQQLSNAGQLNQLSNEQALINRSLGTDTRLETIEKINASSRTYLAELQRISNEMQTQIAATKAAGGEVDALELRWQRVLVEMGRVRVSLDENGNLFKKTFIDGFQGFFDRVIDGTDRVGSSWKKLVGDIRGSLLKLIAEDLLGKLFRTQKDANGNPVKGVLDEVGTLLGKVIRGPEGGRRDPPQRGEFQRDDEGNIMPSTTEFDDEGNAMPSLPVVKDKLDEQLSGVADILTTGFGGMFGKLGGVLKGLFDVFGKDFVDLAKQGFSMLKGVMGFADGGLFRGAGTGTSDSNIIAVSDHEYIMPAKETRAWLPVLETMRAGKFGEWLSGIGGLVQGIRVPTSARFAQGGLVNGQSLAPQVQVIQTQTPATNVNLRLEPQMINMTLRDWLEGELGRIAATR